MFLNVHLGGEALKCNRPLPCSLLFKDSTKNTYLPTIFRLVEITMATDAVRSQVAAKWQESFNRLNGSAPGISGLLSLARSLYYYSPRVIAQNV